MADYIDELVKLRLKEATAHADNTNSIPVERIIERLEVALHIEGSSFAIEVRDMRSGYSRRTYSSIPPRMYAAMQRA